MRQIARHLLELFYPRLCMACATNLPPQARSLCLYCQLQLPKTDYHLSQENPFTQRFWGRVPLHTGAALYHFDKGGKVQRLIHQLKYKGQQQIGSELGQLYGEILRDTVHYQGIEVVVPVPLHPRKQHERGYNQSEPFARGLAAAMQISCEPDALLRRTYAASQTAKSRQDRMENVLQAFSLREGRLAGCRSVLLVDDVLTTGATLEACSHAILEQQQPRISLATIAMASQ
jgi:competence protein ComFC